MSGPAAAPLKLVAGGIEPCGNQSDGELLLLLVRLRKLLRGN